MLTKYERHCFHCNLKSKRYTYTSTPYLTAYFYHNRSLTIGLFCKCANYLAHSIMPINYRLLVLPESQLFNCYKANI